jgi:hypothetical protein
MEMFLMGLALSLIGVGVYTVLFAAATRDVREMEQAPAVRPEARVLAETPRFFVHRGAAAATPRPVQVPIEVLLLQIERHVRLEQAAAESFHLYPTAESLHQQTLSPLVH